ncbi:hypothetical protein [Streptomyces endophytica]|uniref:Uncharacterized protein n=1 Tax=Streptomyces endophytica TaxID=2991496 RepID=A0ABY6P9K6_9ACTN|nr:hypothetical protein [Streptomyces endophytica]UZJ30504.1 hypothetical protein OJ254_09235 [Streptomyces endophytica]
MAPEIRAAGAVPVEARTEQVRVVVPPAVPAARVVVRHPARIARHVVREAGEAVRELAEAGRSPRPAGVAPARHERLIDLRQVAHEVLGGEGIGPEHLGPQLLRHVVVRRIARADELR